MEVHDFVQKVGIKTIPKKNKCKKAKWLSKEGLQIAVKRKDGSHEIKSHLLLGRNQPMTNLDSI